MGLSVNENEVHESSTKLFIEEFKTLWKFSWPMCVGTLCLFSWALLPLILSGHLGRDKLAGAGMAFMFSNVTGRSVLQGLCIGVIPLAAQANGAGNMARVGEVCRRGWLVLLVFSIPVAALWVFTDPILRLVGQSHEVSHLAGEFMRVRLAGLPFFTLYLALRTVLRVSMNMRAMLVANAVVTVFNFGIAFASIHWLGFLGAPLTVAASDALAAGFCLVAVVRCGAWSKYWGVGFGRATFQGWWEILRVSLPGTLMMCTEWWSSEITLLLAGLLGKNETATQPLLSFSAAVFFCLALGQGIATAARVGNLLGSARPDAARRAAFVSMVSCTFIGLASGGLLIGLRRVWGRIWTSNDEVIAMVDEVMPYTCIYVVADALKSSTNNILQGAGRVKVPAVVNFFSAYCVGIPLAWALAFHWSMGLKGLWIGISAGASVMAGSLSVVVVTLNWAHLAKRAVEKAGASKQGDAKTESASDEERLSLLAADNQSTDAT